MFGPLVAMIAAANCAAGLARKFVAELSRRPKKIIRVIIPIATNALIVDEVEKVIFSRGISMATTYSIVANQQAVTLGPDITGVATAQLGQTTTPTYFTVTRSGDLPAENDAWTLSLSPGLTGNYFQQTSGNVIFTANQTQAVIQVNLNNTIVPPNEINKKGFGYTFGVSLGKTGSATSIINDSQSGGNGVTIHDYTIVGGGGTLTLNYDMYTIPDKADIYVNGVLAATTTNFVPGTGTLTVGGSILAAGTQVKAVITGNDPGTSWQYTLNYTPGIASNVTAYEQVNFPAPTLIDLANMANASYSAPASTVGNFRVVGFSPSNFGGFQAVAFANPDDSQIVISFRGSQLSIFNPWDFIKNWLVEDPSFVNGHASSALHAMVGSAAAFVRSIFDQFRANNPTANITLTGHSLGGAVAQIVGRASGLATTAFDAPGAGAFYGELSSDVAPAAGLSSTTKANLNYRLEGDPVSRAGTPTVGTTSNFMTINNTVKTFTWWKDPLYHSLSPLLAALQSSQPITSGIPAEDVNTLPQLQGMLLGTAAVTAVYAPVLALTFAAVVATAYYLDPTSGSTYTLTRNAGSPAFSTVTMPAWTNVASYQVSTSAGGAFTSLTTIAPGSTLSIGNTVTSIKFTAIDSSGNPVVLPTAFVLGVTFASSGTADLTISSYTKSYINDLNADGRSDLIWQNAQGQAAAWLLNGASVSNPVLVGGANGANWTIKGVADIDADGQADIIWQNDQGQAVAWLMNTSGSQGAAVNQAVLLGGANGSAWNIRAVADVNGDGRADIVWENDKGQAVVWFMNGSIVSGGVTVGTPNGGNWVIRGAGDLNGDGMADIVWQNSQGQASVWLMNGPNLSAASLIGGVNGPGWQIKGVGDINGDGKADIVWQNTQGQAAAWFMNGTTVTSASFVGVANGSNVQIKQVADINSDGKAELIWQTDQAQAVAWTLNGTSISSASAILGANGSSWSIAGGNNNPTRYDLNGDGKADLVWQSAQGQAAIWQMDGSSLASATLSGGANGANLKIKAVADISGDGLSDIIWQTDDGQAIGWIMNGSNVVSGVAIGGVNGSGMQIAASGDLNSDGMSDIIWQTSQGQAIGWLMNGTTVTTAALIGPALGADWKLKATGDVNGDGKADLLWQNSQGQAVAWLMNGTDLIGAVGVGDANGADWQLVGLGDLNGDGKSDLVWQNGQGQAVGWLMNGSSIASAALLGQANGAQWKVSEVADLNGDGKADLAWTDMSSGQGAAWLMNGTSIASASLVAGANGADWRIA